MYTIVITGLRHLETVDQIKHMVKTYMVADGDCPFIRRCVYDDVCDECVDTGIHVLHTPDC